MRPTLDPARQCDGKRRYSTRRGARRARSRTPAGDGHFAIYRCPWCDTFHIGHAPNDPAMRDVDARRDQREAAATLEADTVSATMAVLRVDELEARRLLGLDDELELELELEADGEVRDG